MNISPYANANNILSSYLSKTKIYEEPQIINLLKVSLITSKLLLLLLNFPC